MPISSTMPVPLLVSAVGAVALLLTPTAVATTYHVSPCGDDAWSGLSPVCAAPDGPKATINAAILAGTVDGDEVIVADGTYTGPGNVNIVFNGNQRPDMTIRSEHGAATTIVDAASGGRFMSFVFVDDAVVLEGFTVRNGLAVEGAAVRCAAAGPVIRDCVFEDGLASGSEADGGGAIKCESSSSPRIEGCVFRRNGAGIASGGALYFATSGGTVTGCLFEDNSSGFQASGGAVFTTGTSNVAFERCEFRENGAQLFGGGVAHFGGPETTFTDCMFLGNSAIAGAGLTLSAMATVERCVFDGNFTGGEQSGASGMLVIGSVSPLVVDSVFTLNTGGLGAGVGVSDAGSDPLFVNCLFTENSAVGSTLISTGGAAAIIDGAAPWFINCTFVNNEASESGGAVTSILNAAPRLVGCILRGNEAPLGPALALERVFDTDPTPEMTVSYSNVQGGEAGVYIDSGPDALAGEGPLFWLSGNIDADPVFVDAKRSDFRLGPGSPCIDAADNTPMPPRVVTDLDGNPRFVDDLGTPDTGEGGNAPLGTPIADMGAYEFQGLTPPLCPDLDGGGTIGFGDLIMLLAAWGPCPGCPEDLTSDGVVEMRDLMWLLSRWGPCE